MQNLAIALKDKPNPVGRLTELLQPMPRPTNNWTIPLIYPSMSEPLCPHFNFHISSLWNFFLNTIYWLLKRLTPDFPMPDWLTISVAFAIGGLIFAFGKWYGNVNSDRKSFKEFMREVKEDIGGMQEKIDRILDRTFPPSRLITSKSPLSLTDLGEEVAEDLNAEDWADKKALRVWEDVQEMEDYEVHEYCFDRVRTPQFTGNMKGAIRKIAYEHGISTEDIYDVLAIVLRDVILERREEGEGLSTTE